MEDDELKNFIKLWLIAITSTIYCHIIPPRVAHGVLRLLTLLPVITLFFILPLPISTVHLAFPTIYSLVWLANFKLVLFAFNRGPLSSTPHLPILSFISTALLPINLKQSNKKVSFWVHKPIFLMVKTLILIMIISVYHRYKDRLDHNVLLVLYNCHLCLNGELVLAIVAYTVMIIFGYEIDRQFNEPYLATSLEDFWGRRWNRMSSSILRVSVYNPIRMIWPDKASSQMLATVVTFIVSGLMHELMYLYLTRVPPTWEVTWFFVLQGVCTAVEVAVKKAVNGRFRLHRVVSTLLTVSFLLVTGGWLFLPQLVRNGVVDKIINESSILLELFRSN